MRLDDISLFIQQQLSYLSGEARQMDHLGQYQARETLEEGHSYAVAFTHSIQFQLSVFVPSIWLCKDGKSFARIRMSQIFQ